MNDEPILEMSFDLKTIDHLGIKMYSRIPNAIAELIANAYDADASKVEIKLYDDNEGKRIEIIDDGIGMTFDDINQKFLRIGRNRRYQEGVETQKGRKVTGKKGLGKLALFGIGNIIDVKTSAKGSNQRILFTLNWEELKSHEEGSYNPKFEFEPYGKNEHGSTIILKAIRKNSPFDKDSLAISLSKLFNCFDKNFKCYISLNDDEPLSIDNDFKFGNLNKEFTWNFPEKIGNIKADYEHKDKISGQIICAAVVLKQEIRGISLFANGRLVNTNEFFDVKESSHGFSYMTGFLDVSFIDDMNEDLISTNRQSLSWDEYELSELREFLAVIIRYVAQDIRIKRKEKKRARLQEKANINANWYRELPQEIKADVEPIVESIEDSAMDTDLQADAITRLHNLVPESPYLHWRNLHEEVQNACREDYEDGRYYDAVKEAIIRYTSTVYELSNSKISSDASMMGDAFGTNGILSVTDTYEKELEKKIKKETKQSIEEGQKFLSMGIVNAARNPIAHNEKKELKKTGLFTEKDCLDALSILSHLFRRLDKASKKQKS